MLLGHTETYRWLSLASVRKWMGKSQFCKTTLVVDTESISLAVLDNTVISHEGKVLTEGEQCKMVKVQVLEL